MTPSRLHTLKKSNDNFPYGVVMVEGRGPSPGNLQGYSRLSLVHGDKQACFVESVIIARSLRGKGLGRKLMEGTESVAKSLGFKTCYLTTHDKQDFYTRVGYTYCQPIVSLGGASSLLSNHQIGKLLGPRIDDLGSKEAGNKPGNNVTHTQNGYLYCKPTTPVTSAPQTPIPVQQDPHVPSPPPLPPNLPPLSSSESTKTLPVRLDPSKVFWMKKDIES